MLRLGGPGTFGGFGTFGGSPKHETKKEHEMKLSPQPGYVSVAQICRGIQESHFVGSVGVEFLNIFEGLGVYVMWFISYLCKRGTANILSCRNVVKKITSDVFFVVRSGEDEAPWVS